MVVQILAKIKIKIGYLAAILIVFLAAILKRYNISNFFFLQNCDFFSPYIYGANFIAKFGWESGFLRLGP